MEFCEDNYQEWSYDKGGQLIKQKLILEIPKLIIGGPSSKTYYDRHQLGL
jgi:hypothetical protein